jgi:YD repeat-containing protein
LGRSIPGNRSDMPFTPTSINDHTGRSQKQTASCKEVQGVDEEKVNKLLEIGKPMGPWTPWNQCQSFARDVLEMSSYGPISPSPSRRPRIYLSKLTDASGRVFGYEYDPTGRRTKVILPDNRCTSGHRCLRRCEWNYSRWAFR